MPAAILALCCYAVITVALMVMTVKTRGWFMITAVVTGALEALGFVARCECIWEGKKGGVQWGRVADGPPGSGSSYATLCPLSCERGSVGRIFP